MQRRTFSERVICFEPSEHTPIILACPKQISVTDMQVHHMNPSVRASYRGAAHPMVSACLIRQALQGIQQIGGITKVEMKVMLTIGCVAPLYYAPQGQSKPCEYHSVVQAKVIYHANHFPIQEVKLRCALFWYPVTKQHYKKYGPIEYLY